MNLFWKIIFWTLTIALGFVNPVITFVMVLLYYLPEIIPSLCKACNEACGESVESTEHTDDDTKTTYNPEQVTPEMNSFSDDTLEDMK